MSNDRTCPAPAVVEKEWGWGTYRDPTQRCGKPVPTKFIGRPGKYCSDACRQAAHRAHQVS